jgi:hypothetical protein
MDILEGWQRLDIGRDHVRHRFDACADRRQLRDRGVESGLTALLLADGGSACTISGAPNRGFYLMQGDRDS